MFAALSDPEIRPRVAPYVAVFHAFAPIVYLDGNKVPVINLDLAAYLRKLITAAAEKSNIHAVNTGTCAWDQSSINYWNDYCRFDPKRCYDHVKLEDLYPAVDNWAREGYHKILGPSGSSYNCVLHYAQLLNTQVTQNKYAFPKFDYGSPEANRAKYGQSTPPNYNLKNIREKVRLWVGTKDTLATVPEAERIVSVLSEVTSVQMKTWMLWGHETFHFATDNTSQFADLISELNSE